jgi:cytosine deaminase
MSMLIKHARLKGEDLMKDIFIDQGMITEIGNEIQREADEVIDAEGHLVIPPMIDPHIHLDKILIGESIRENVTGTLTEAIEIIWDRKRNYTQEDIIERASSIVERAITKGTLYMRTHADVDTICGLEAVKALKKVKEKYADIFHLEIVAFPQEGILKDPGTEKLMWEAMKAGADIVGGMPANENNPDDSWRHIEIAFEIANAFDADIDMHVDETDDPLYRTLEMLADLTIANGYQDRVTAGHTCALAAYDDHYAQYVMDKVKDAGIYIITNPVTNLMLQGRSDQQPIRRGITRVKELMDRGIDVCYGQDCIRDAFYPFGQADLLEVGLITAHAAQLGLPKEIEKLFDMPLYTSARLMHLEDYGIAVGKRGDVVILEAYSPLEALRFQSARLKVIKGGHVISEEQRTIKTYFEKLI